MSDDIDAFQASLLRTLASAHRLRIIHLLGSRDYEVGELGRELGLDTPATSHHLAAMRSVGIVDSVRDGRFVRYRLSDPGILDACELMRDVLLRRLARLADMAAHSRAPGLPHPSTTQVTQP
jgi:DNA-binding transcriptional ArsR family regulator